MQSPDNTNAALSINVPSYPVYPRDDLTTDANPYRNTNLNPYRTENSMNKETQSPSAGGLRSPSSPSSSNTLDPLLLTQQQVQQRDAQATAHRSTHRAPSVTVIPATVMQNNLQFAGDHRFPPGRPTINRDISRPDQTAAINSAVAAWGDVIPAGRPVDLAASLRAIQNLLNSPPAAAADIIRPRQLEPFAEMDPASALCDPASFLDPEHKVCAIDDRDTQALDGSIKKSRLLPKRGMSRRLNGVPAGAGHLTDSIDLQDRRIPSGAPGNMSNARGSILPAPAVLAAAPLQVTPLRLMPPQVDTAIPAAAGTSRKVFRRESSPILDVYSRRRQPETGATLPGMDVDSRVPYQTPREVREVDLLLNRQAMVENQEAWMQRQLDRIIRMWTVSSQSVVAAMMVAFNAPVDSLEERVQVIEDSCPSTNTPRPLPRICDAPRDVAEANNQPGSLGTGVCGQAPRGAMTAFSAGIPTRSERQVATVQAAMTPSLCSAGHPPPPAAGGGNRPCRQQYIHLPPQRQGWKEGARGRMHLLGSLT